MKKIGRQVCFISVSEDNPRNGEGSFARLKNGEIMYAYTEYRGGGREDHACASLSACISPDEGESWSKPKMLIRKDEGAENVMSPSLVRLPDGGLGIVYLRKEKKEDGGIVCMPVFSRSEDEGKSWSEPRYCTDREGYYCVINDGVTVLRSGGILVPMAYHGHKYYHGSGFPEKRGGSVRFVRSDDCGASWRDLNGEIESPMSDVTGFAEPGVYEHENGELWAWCRTSYGYQYRSVSTDGGASWSAPTPSLLFTSPDSPMRVKRVGEYTVAVYNPIGHNFFSHGTEDWGAPKRTPLACAVCREDGRSFEPSGKFSVNRELAALGDSLYLLEDDRSESYCYPAIIGVSGGFLVGYYHSGGTGHCLTCNKITKVSFDEITSREVPC